MAYSALLAVIEARPKNMETTKDLEHLKLLSIFHYVACGLVALFATVFGGIYLLVGLLAMLSPMERDGPGQGLPVWFGLLFATIGAVALLMGWVLAAFLFAAGRLLARRRRRIFCMVVAGISCIFMPVGTALGVFTLIVLSTDSVRKLFDPQPQS